VNASQPFNLHATIPPQAGWEGAERETSQKTCRHPSKTFITDLLAFR